MIRVTSGRVSHATATPPPPHRISPTATLPLTCVDQSPPLTPSHSRLLVQKLVRFNASFYFSAHFPGSL
ncbi:hypothetical protein E2C01_081950 [Portunus trituberculatus]|uniref:Uncharacterized protein n=1 Tax=Portunus trituberculatus TaxID=210409 RepID=A0A5B7IXU6_PORTR|nr:hypothetical protein [Portunus trituberculatus]